MKFEIALTKDSLRETLMNIIESYSEQLNDEQTETFKGLLHLEKEISIENQSLFCTDVSYALSLCVELLSQLELTAEDKNEVDQVLSRILQAKELDNSKHIEIGKMVTYEGLPYQIVEIDYDEFTVCLSDGDEMGGGCIDVGPTDIDNPNSNSPVDYIEHLNPIIDDVKDGEPEPLCMKTIDSLMKVLRAKVEFREGHISEEESIKRIHSAWD